MLISACTALSPFYMYFSPCLEEGCCMCTPCLFVFGSRTPTEQHLLTVIIVGIQIAGFLLHWLTAACTKAITPLPCTIAVDFLRGDIFSHTWWTMSKITRQTGSKAQAQILVLFGVLVYWFKAMVPYHAISSFAKSASSFLSRE